MALISANAIAAGVAFIADPTGSLLGMTTLLLQYSPFENFLVPGIVLLVLNGVIPGIAFILALTRHRTHLFWMKITSVLILGWIMVQAVMLRELYIMHYGVAATGLLILIYAGVAQDKQEVYQPMKMKR